MRRVSLSLLALLLAPTLAYAASVTLVWDYTQGTDPGTGFSLSRCTGTRCRQFVTLTPVPLPIDVLTYTDTTVRPGRTYRWYVQALNAQGPSARSNILTYRVPMVPAGAKNLRQA